MSRQSNLRRASHLYRRLQAGRECVYCGETAQTTDHVAPLSVVAAIAGLVKMRGGLLLVPACLECNSLAGSTPFTSIGAKRRFVQKRLRRRYAKHLAIPDWSEAGLAELGPSLRGAVEAGIRVRDRTRLRLAWVNSFPQRLAAWSVERAA